MQNAYANNQFKDIVKSLSCIYPFDIFCSDKSNHHFFFVTKDLNHPENYTINNHSNIDKYYFVIPTDHPIVFSCCLNMSEQDISTNLVIYTDMAISFFNYSFDGILGIINELDSEATGRIKLCIDYVHLMIKMFKISELYDLNLPPIDKYEAEDTISLKELKHKLRDGCSSLESISLIYDADRNKLEKVIVDINSNLFNVTSCNRHLYEYLLLQIARKTIYLKYPYKDKYFLIAYDFDSISIIMPSDQLNTPIFKDTRKRLCDCNIALLNLLHFKDIIKLNKRLPLELRHPNIGK